jgi:beta-lactamase superfamily II metal-dependent hydrolase
MANNKQTKKQKITKTDIKKIKKYFVFSYLRLAICIVLLLAVAGVWYFAPIILKPQIAKNSGAPLYFHAIDVGDGDCLVVELPDEKILMVDTGTQSAFNSNVKNYLETKLHYDMNDKKIDYFINTHPDSDHYGGVYKLFQYFDVINIYRPYFDSGSTLDDDLPTITGMSNSEQTTFNNKVATYGNVVDAMYA